MQIGYWPIRARAEVLRMLLKYLNLDYQEVNYTPKTWFPNKDNLGFDFPNLPYLIDGDNKITESQALNYYICRKSGRMDLLGVTDEEKLQYSTLQSMLIDIYEKIYLIVSSDDPMKKYKIFKRATFNHQIKKLSKYLDDKEYLIGYLTLADFYFAYIFEIMRDLQVAMKDQIVWDQY